ncbi:MAG: SURF1 family protein [Burkholderiaceae bacterium]|nr:SURF1 family protein [Burkholderiaceae bacterium]
MRPRTAVPTLAALALVIATVSLGNWQMRRADEKRALHAQREAADHDAPVQLSGGDIDPATLIGRRVVARGQFVPRWTVFVDNRTHKGIAGFHVLSPLRITGSDRHVLVLRGWIARDPHDRARLPALHTPSGEVEVEGRAEHDLERVLELGSTAPPGPQDRLWQNADVAAFARWSGLAMQPLLLRQTSAPRVGQAGRDDGLVREWPDPGSGVDKHLGYAFQWYALAVLAAGLWVRFVVFGRRAGERKDER